MTASLLPGLIVSSLFLGMPSSTAADQTAPDQTAPDLLRAVHERQERMLAGIRDVTITHEDPRLSPTEHTIYAERSTGPNGSDLLARFNRHAETDWGDGSRSFRSDALGYRGHHLISSITLRATCSIGAGRLPSVPWGVVAIEIGSPP